MRSSVCANGCAVRGCVCKWVCNERLCKWVCNGRLCVQMGVQGEAACANGCARRGCVSRWVCNEMCVQMGVQ